MTKLFKYYNLHLQYFSRNVKLFLIGGLFNGIGFSVFSLLFNLYLIENGFSEAEIGKILSWGSLGSALVAIPAAILLERVHVRKVLIISTILASLAYFMSIYSKILSFIFFFIFFANMFLTVYRVSIAPFFMRNSTKRERIFLFSFNGAIGILSQLIGFMLGGYLPKLLMSLNFTDSLAIAYEWSLYLSVIGSLISIIPFFKIKQMPIPETRKRFINRFKDYSWQIIIRLMIPRLLVGMGAGLIIPFMNLYFKLVFGADSSSIGTFFSILQFFLFLGMISTPFFVKKMGMLRTIVLTQLFSIPFMFILALSNNLSLAVIAFIARGTLMNLSQPVASNFEMEIVKPNEHAFTNAVSTLSWQGSWTISALAGGYIIEKYSFAWSFYITIVLYLLSSISYFAFFRNKKSQTAQ
ncbi:MAG: MFS transporter [Candidatus Cloacimonetes bacterium]|nr:MFS transporter [Candidatus Cloacimonadota bacterium]